MNASSLYLQSTYSKKQHMAETPDSFDLRWPWWIFVSTAFVLAACLLFIALAAGSLAQSWDICSLIGGLFILPIPIVLGVQQYRGTFRYRPRSARNEGILLAVISGICWLGSVTTTYELASEWHSSYWWPLGFLSGAACLNALAAWTNLRWFRLLRQAEALGSLPDGGRRFSLREFLLVVAGCSIVAAAVGYSVWTAPPQHAEHVTAGEAPLGLPKGATDVSYCQGSRGIIACEFTCDESAFIEWVDSGIGSIESSSSGRRVQPITSTYSITRYTHFMPHGRINASADIDNGLYYDWSHEDRGVYAAYDRDTGRGYYYFHAH